MMRLTGVRMSCLLVCLPLATTLGSESLLAQKQDATACLAYEPSSVELTGSMRRETFGDALDRPETVCLLDLSRPICVDEDPIQPDLNYAQKDVQSIQLVFLDRKMYVKYKDLVGKKVIARGTLFAGITAHHHTSVLLTVSKLRVAR